MSRFIGGGGGGLVLLASAEPSAVSEIDFEGIDGYTDYLGFKIDMFGVRPSANAAIGLRVKTASTWRTSGYQDVFQNQRPDASNGFTANSSVSYMEFRSSVGAGLVQNGEVFFSAHGAYLHPFRWTSAGDDSSPWLSTILGGGYFDTTAQIEGVRVFATGGTLSGGAISLFGVPK